MQDSVDMVTGLRTAPEQFIEREIKEFVRTDPGNLLPPDKTIPIWDEPLVGFAAGDDPVFDEFKSVASPGHLAPREALAASYGKNLQEIPEALSVICWILPVMEETRKSNYNQTTSPSRPWSHTRWYGEKFNEKLRIHMVELLRDVGYLAAAPFLEPCYKVSRNEKGLYSNWSERHLAYAAGLGTFSLSDGLITERGIAHRCGSVVTSLELPPTPRTAANRYANCLAYAGVKCRACINRCPAGAITKDGHDKEKCRLYLRDLGYSHELLKGGYNDETSVFGCGLCQTKVPCEFRNPVGALKKKTKKDI